MAQSEFKAFEMWRDYFGLAELVQSRKLRDENEETKKKVLEFPKNGLSTFKCKWKGENRKKISKIFAFLENSRRYSAVKAKQKGGYINFALHLCPTTTRIVPIAKVFITWLRALVEELRAQNWEIVSVQAVKPLEMMHTA